MSITQITLVVVGGAGGVDEKGDSGGESLCRLLLTRKSGGDRCGGGQRACTRDYKPTATVDEQCGSASL